MLRTAFDLAERRPIRCMLWITALMVMIAVARYVEDPPRLTDDQTSNWWPVVNALLDGKGFVECLPEYFPFCGPDNHVSAMREPLPLVAHAAMALISGRSLWVASLFQAILNILVAWLLFRLVVRMASASQAVVAALLWALYLPAYQDLIHIGGDQMATVLLLLAMITFQRAAEKNGLGSILLSGLLLGGASLCRSALLAFALVAMAVLLFSRMGKWQQRLVRTGVLALGLGLALAPWAVRNYLAFDRAFIGSTLSGYNLFRHNQTIRSEHYCRYVASEEAQACTDSLIAAHPELTGHENEAEMNALYASAAKRIIGDHPIRYMALSAYRALPLWFNWKVMDAYGQPSTMLDHAMAIGQLILLVLAILGFIRSPSWRWQLGLGILLYCAMHMAVVSRMRYLLPVMPLVMVFSAAALCMWMRRSSNAQGTADAA